jgi:hypothetical protein
MNGATISRPEAEPGKLVKMKMYFDDRYKALNEFIYCRQKVIARFYSKYFTMYAALIFSLGAGACLGFTGENCYGKIPFNSPLFWCLLLVVMFFFFQTFLLIPLTFGRLSRLLVVAVCGHYLTYQAYGFWSLKNLDNIVDVFANTQACKPYAYANIAYGHFWLNVPAVALILICFFAGNKKLESEK